MSPCLLYTSVGPPVFDEKDTEFGKRLAETFDKSMVENMRKSPDFQELPELKDQVLNTCLLYTSRCV